MVSKHDMLPPIARRRKLIVIASVAIIMWLLSVSLRGGDSSTQSKTNKDRFGDDDDEQRVIIGNAVVVGRSGAEQRNSNSKQQRIASAHLEDNHGKHIFTDLPGLCPIQSKTFEPLTTFQFWGRTMNVSSPCPTAGLNNQLTMLIGLVHCSLGTANTEGIFRFKDITCSPTGGKEGRKHFRVGSEDYEYQWFRWSELFLMTEPAPNRALCFADEHSWSEHAWMKRCPTMVEHIYGTPEFWTMRKSLKLHTWFDQLARQLIDDSVPAHTNLVSSEVLAVGTSFEKKTVRRDEEETEQRGYKRSNGGGGGSDGVPPPPFIAIHVRRGDYENFCRQTAKSSGVKKFRTAPFVWMQRASEPQLNAIGLQERPTQVSSKFMTSCFPGTAHVVATVAKICVKHPEMAFLFVATNSRSFLKDLREGLLQSSVDCARHMRIVTLSEYLAKEDKLGLAARHQSYWGRRAATTSKSADDGGVTPEEDRDGVVAHQNQNSAVAAHHHESIAPAVITETEISLLDVDIISFAGVMVLNKYSTFSQSAIDFRMVREGSLRGASIYWW